MHRKKESPDSRIMDQTRKAFMYTPENFISRMPDIVITNILDRLPLQDAVRTGILSRDWRFKWTMLSKLIFDEKFYEYLLKTQRLNSYRIIVTLLLLHLNGTITTFVLHINYQCRSINIEDINNWILLLSTKGIEDLTIFKENEPVLKLPDQLFSCLDLKHLNLFMCCFDNPASFHGFPKLLSLELGLEESESGKFGEFITKCPALESLSIVGSEDEVKLAEIAKLANLKTLSLFLYNLDDTCSRNSIFDLMGSLPKLQELYLNFEHCKFTADGAYKRLPTIFPCLKTLKLSALELSEFIIFSCAFEMIRSFPNLQTLEINENEMHVVPTPAVCSLDVDFNSMGLLQLRSVVITYYKASENDVCLIKYILACSPFLKKLVIRPHSFLKDTEKFMFAKKLLKLHRASPTVDIYLY